MPGQLVDRRLVPQLHEHEIGLQRLRPRQPGALGRTPQHLPEIRIRVRGRHLPQRPPQPRPGLLQVRDIAADRPVRQPRRGPRQHEPGQHIGLERRQLLRTRRNPPLPQIPDSRQSHPAPQSHILTAAALTPPDTIELQHR
jgi:hypothetical protein